MRLVLIELHISTYSYSYRAWRSLRCAAPSWHLRRALGESRLITKVTCNHGRAETVSSDQGHVNFLILF